jgi:superfamily I DNA/RNA helicase/mRNA-degrading endonuclease RelE of RelBE toxin-antitoxin system
MANTVAISTEFLSAFASLPRQVQGKVTEFINTFKNNPVSTGINYEKINGTVDKKIWSVRIDDTYRGIVIREEDTGTYLLLWVDHHDEAYDWARRKKCDINRKTGAIQIFDIEYKIPEVPINPKKPNLFAFVDDDSLRLLGIPSEQIPFIRNIPNLEILYSLKLSFPEDVYENLEWVANGFSIEEVLQLKSDKEQVLPDNIGLQEALKTIDSQKSFVIIEGEEELRRIMAEPLEKWRIFLHPSQRKIVERKYSGPARVLGGAGTGKTVVAMHRAKRLASKLKGNEKILFTTFTANLAFDITNNLRKICTLDELRHIDIINLDAWISRYLRENGYAYKIIYDDELNAIWQEAIAQADELGLSEAFYQEEWLKVVSPQEAFTQDMYFKASRIGRGTPLDRKKRAQIWKVFDSYQNILRDKRVRDVELAMFECYKILEQSPAKKIYQYIIIDEGQDFGNNAFRLVRSLAGEEHENDIFIVGDAHQRIYRNKAILSRCGINIRGRSSYLRINYRTTEETRKFAFSLLQGIKFDDLDEDYDEGRICQSLTHGKKPEVENFKGLAEELNYIVTEIKKLIDNGVSLNNICLVARTHRLLDDYKARFTEEKIRTYEIKQTKNDVTETDSLRLATMHRVKGLEFQYVFVAAVNDRIVPYYSAIDHTDSVTELETLTAEKCLLYVALTRAQKSAYITSYGKQSGFLNV